MDKYISFGGGVNSVALVLLAIRDGWYQECEAVFIHHGTDHPDTYDYLAWFQDWLKVRGHRPITVLYPTVQGDKTLYDWFYRQAFLPSVVNRSCTAKWKVRILHKHYRRPCFEMIGIDAGELRRSRLSVVNGIESRWPLIEAGLNRQGCIELIKSFAVPVPPKSGCFICPYQSSEQWKRLRLVDPELFCKAKALEDHAIERIRERRGHSWSTDYLSKYPGPLHEVVSEKQLTLFKELEYPCSDKFFCGLFLLVRKGIIKANCV
jgi:hypothetical protein